MATDKKTPTPVLDLISKLEASGTGKEKLETILAIGCECTDPHEFMERVSKAVPEGTFKKIVNIVGPLPSKKPVKAETVKAEPPAKIETPPTA